MPIVSTTKMTAGQFLQLGEDPPGVRLELVNGELAVSPSLTPDHSYVVVQLVLVLESHNRQHMLGELYNDVNTILDRFNVRRPDVLFFFKHRTHLVGKKAMEGPPDLAVEVLSPSSVEVDREDKFEQYRAAGVRFYWIVDPKLQTIDAWELVDGAYVHIGRAQGAATINLRPFPDLEIPLAQLWRR
ncbi:MAG TPA: Uma2 family endonuclease [Tepidisphaeraceae bacterium]|jgi:Uma2 family endonuclease|nr:Uma2 family endonuclease [Tepidisphaeraceae bacterium]